jgi:CubicO group peptidase (beta-lactamase class C family)
MLLRSHLRIVAFAIGLTPPVAGMCASHRTEAVAAAAPATVRDTAKTPEFPKRVAGEEAAAYMQRVAALGFSGEVLASVGDTIVLHAAYGLAIPATRVAYDTTTPTYIGSLTKQFTAAAILKLAEEGRLSVQDSIGRFVNGVPSDKAGITIHQLLTHTAGVPDTVGERYGNEFISRDALVRRVLAAPLEPPPRSFSYSSSGYAFLAAIVEIASGERYEDYLRQHLFRKAHLTYTGYTLAPELMRRAAHARRGMEDLGSPQSRKTWTADGPTWALRGAGGMLSTAADLNRWYRALRAGTILSRQSVEQLFAEIVPEDSTRTSFYGYGWYIVPESPHGKVIGHNGSDGIFYATLVNFAERNVIVIVLMNQQPSGFRRVEAGLTAAMYDRIGAAGLTH